MTASLRIGNIELHHRLGRGGMGEVFYGVAQATGEAVAVAVKVLTNRLARDPRYRQSFYREVRAAARLYHPGIITLLDYGAITAETAGLSRGALVAGSPFIVMEYGNDGSLESHAAAPSFRHARDILLSLLDALAHAHARDVIHRDLKPGNVLFSKVRGAHVVKLTDFGIARALDDTGPSAVEDPVGTPHYVAPEQIVGQVRHQGPWTDLYALGCLATQLVCGRPPFLEAARSINDLIHAHLHAAPPPLNPLFPIPDGLGVWVDRLLAKAPEDRFLCAIDAARALAALPTLEAEVDAVTEIMPLRVAPELPPLQTLPLPTVTGQFEIKRLKMAEDDGRRADEPRPTTVPAPELPERWQRPEPLPPEPTLTGAGLGLFGLRQIPLVGREVERDVLWETLRRVNATGRPEVVFVSGPAGIGKSRLVRWWTERARECACIPVMRAEHSAVAPPTRPTSTMIATSLVAAGLPDAERRAHLERILAPIGVSEADREAWTDALADEPTHHHPSRGAHVTLVTRLLRRMASRRLILLWLEDVHYSALALDLIERLLRSPADGRVAIAIAATYREDVLRERPPEARRVKALTEHPSARTLALQPLDHDAQCALVQQLLGLDDDAAAQVEQRSEGNPLFAVQLVGDWVRRHILRPTPHGFELDPAANLQLPDDLHALWTQRLTAVLDDLPHALVEPAQHALELAAVLGPHIDFTEWHLACDHAGLVANDDLLSALARDGLVQLDTHGWSFTHGMLRESLERHAAETHRLPSHQLAIAAMLEALHPHHPAVAERLAVHLLGARQFERALDPLLRAAEHLAHDAPGRALELLDTRDRLMQFLDLPAEDPRHTDGLPLRARLER